MIKPVLFRSNYLYVFGLILLVSALPVSFFMTSVAQFVLAGSFFLEGNFVVKFRRYFKNKPALIITGLLLLHVIGLLWTTNFAEGLKDIRIKLPLLILPVIFAGNEPLSKKHFHLVMGFFIASVFTGTLISMAVLTGLIHREITDIREIFIFHVSHIRFALFTCIAVFSLLHFIISGKYRIRMLLKIVYALLMLWLLFFLVIMESVTGIIISIVILVFLLLYHAFIQRKVFVRVVLILAAIIIPASLYYTINEISNQYNTVKDIPIDLNAKTAEGHPYRFDLLNEQFKSFENGYPVWAYVCEDEIRKEWNVRSRHSYDSLDLRNQEIKYTLIRFLTSKGWRKDGDAVSKLSDEEVHSVEKGIANVNYQHLSSIKARAWKIAWEYDQFRHGGELSGHSVMQRLEFWKAATGIIKEHPFIGVGTGDMPASFREQYIKMNSRLDLKYRLRSHNQFLAITVAFGLIGLFYFIFSLVAPMVITGKYLDYFYMVFWMTAVFSMITEDTLETQTGVTFFAFFNCLFLFRGGNDGK